MTALGVEVHLHRDAGVLERDVVDQRLVDAVHVVVLVLEDERGGRLRGQVGADVGVQPGLRQLLVAKGKMAGIDGDGEVGAAGDFVGGVYGRVYADGVDAGGGDKMTTKTEADSSAALRNGNKGAWW